MSKEGLIMSLKDKIAELQQEQLKFGAESDRHKYLLEAELGKNTHL